MKLFSSPWTLEAKLTGKRINPIAPFNPLELNSIRSGDRKSQVIWRNLNQPVICLPVWRLTN